MAALASYLASLRIWLAILSAIAAILAGAPTAAAVGSPSYPLRMEQLRHVQWARRDGAPTVMHGLAETREGFLWVASRDGLFRFDGRSFELMDGTIDRAKYGIPVELMVGHDGTLWVWYPKGWLALYRQGRLHFIRAPDTGGEVATFHQTRDGAIWLGIAQIAEPLLRYHRGRWERVAANPNREMLRDALESADGAFWLSYNRSILRRPPNGRTFERLDIPVTEGSQLAADAQGAVWMAGPSGGRRLTGPRGLWRAAPSRPLRWRSIDRRWLDAQFDRNGNLWTMGGEFGRVPGLVQAERTGLTEVVYEEGNIPQMTSKQPASLFVDRRGSIWYGGPRSLDRFSVSSVIVEPGLKSPATYGDVLFSASDGTVYIGQSDAIYRVAPGSPPARLFPTTTEAEAMCEDRDGSIWIALGDRVIMLAGGRQRVFPKPAAETGIYECGPDPSGRFWLTASTSGMYWRDGSNWIPVTPPAGRATFDPKLLWRDLSNRPWVLTEPHALTRLDGGFAERRPIEDAARIGEVVALLGTSKGLLVSGRDGATFMTPDAKFHLAGQQNKFLRSARGLVQTKRGDTWLFGASELVRVRTSDLEKSFADPAFTTPQRVFSYEDGLPNTPNAQGWRAMVAGGDGRLWLATIDGIAWVDPTNLPSNPTPPGVVITSLISEGRVTKDPAAVRLKPGASDLSIAFAALSLEIPERVAVRYRLEGHDRSWVDPGSRRQAFYTNLAPGDYRFQVIAANEDGVWNRVGDELTLSIPPTFIQSWPFKALCAIVVLGLIWLAYVVRLRTVAGRIRMRMADRVAERERIARDLHDTLLQSVQGLTLRFQLAVDDLPAKARSRPVLEDAIEQADLVIAEGRDRVRDLRLAGQDATIEQVIADILKRQAFDPDVDIRIDVEGSPRDLDPLVLDEVAQIASEAIFNIWRHAQARKIKIEVGYEAAFHVRFLDDGVGIDADIADAGLKPGHYGLSGMRERAKKLNGELVIRRVPEGGSEIVLTVPGAVAYRSRSLRFASIFGRKSSTG